MALYRFKKLSNKFFYERGCEKSKHSGRVNHERKREWWRKCFHEEIWVFKRWIGKTDDYACCMDGSSEDSKVGTRVGHGWQIGVLRKKIWENDCVAELQKDAPFICMGRGREDPKTGSDTRPWVVEGRSKSRHYSAVWIAKYELGI